MNAALGWLFLAALAGPLFVQLALVAGAPWGHLTLGGRWPGRLPPRVRAVCLGQALLLAAMGAAVAGQAGLLALGWPGWAIWAVAGVSLLSMVANLATPSRLERLLWGPATAVMAGSSVALAFL